MYLQHLQGLPRSGLHEEFFNDPSQNPAKETMVAVESLKIKVIDEEGRSWDPKGYELMKEIKMLHGRSLNVKELPKVLSSNGLMLPTPQQAYAFREKQREKQKKERELTQKSLQREKQEEERELAQESLQTKTPILFRPIVPQQFNALFKGKAKVVSLHESLFIPVNPKVGISEHPVVSIEVGPGLALGVVCWDKDNRLSGIGLGHFTQRGVKEFCNDPQAESNHIKLLLQDAFNNAPKVDIFLAGLYSRKHFESLKKKIFSSSHIPHKCEAIMNPWEFRENVFEREDAQKLEEYLNESGFNLRVGIRKSGKIYVDCDMREANTWNEKGFIEWKSRR